MKSRWRAPKIIFFLLLLGSADSQVQKLRVTGKDSPVKGLVGEDVTLPCLLSGVRTPLNLLVVRVLWKLKSHDGTEHQVYHFESFKHSPSRSGSHMAHSDLVQGNFSLYIPHVQISDDGDYICSVLVSPDDGSAKFPLHVSVKPQTALPRFVSIDLSHENSLTVSCDASMFYPETIMIRWVKYSRNADANSSLDGDTCARLPSRNSDGTFNVTSTVIVSPSSIGEDGDKYFCVVSHRSLDEKTALAFILSVSETKMTVGTMIAIIIIVILSIPLLLLSVILYMWRLKKEKPSLLWIVKDERVFHKEKATLFCQITGFRPKRLVINLFLEMTTSENDTNHKELIHSWKSTDDDPSSTNSFTAPESLTAGGRNAKASAIIPLMEIGLERSLLLPVEMKAVITNSDNGTYSCDCSITVTPSADTVDGAKLILEVQHDALKDSISIQRTLQVIRFTPTVEVTIKKGQKKDDINVNCSVKWTHPSYLYITWLKMKENETKQSSICSFPRSVGRGIDAHLCHIIADIEEHNDHVSFCSILILNKSGWKGAQFACTIRHVHTGVWKTAKIQYTDEDESLS
ncbi:uncharacterized protein [Aquarana catesbeiana]|uniref:uncharacterized protein n=1 Tax=Aquarana catesbeiana TaxID=8400 RepID=UPI003CC9C5F6